MNLAHHIGSCGIDVDSFVYEPRRLQEVQEVTQQPIETPVEPQRVLSILKRANPAENRRVQNSRLGDRTSLSQPRQRRVNFQDHIEVIYFSRKGYVTVARAIRPHSRIVDKEVREKTELDKFFACIIFICCEFGNIEPYRRKFGI